MEDGVFSLLQKMDMDDASLLTLYYGSDVAEADANLLQEKIEASYEDLEVEIYRGGQPLYYYLISLE